MPRSVCMYHDTQLIALHLVADSLIFLSYMSIPIMLFVLNGQNITNDIYIKKGLLLYALFICLCGLTHLIGVINIFHTYYWLDGFVKGLTAIVSVLVSLYTWSFLQKIKGMRTAEEYHELENRIIQLEQQLKNK